MRARAPTPALPPAGEKLSESAHADSLAAPQGGPGYDSCRGYNYAASATPRQSKTIELPTHSAWALAGNSLASGVDVWRRLLWSSQGAFDSVRHGRWPHAPEALVSPAGGALV